MQSSVCLISTPPRYPAKPYSAIQESVAISISANAASHSPPSSWSPLVSSSDETDVASEALGESGSVLYESGVLIPLTSDEIPV